MSGDARAIVLVRHGPSAHVAPGWLDGPGLARWQDAYDAAGILADAVPPASLVTLAARAHVVASDLPRAVESATRLLACAGRDLRPVHTPLLRESPIALPVAASVRLPLAAWATVVGARGLVAWLRRHPPDAAEASRAIEAGAWLVARQGEWGGTVLAVTHAAFRGRLARALVAAGWRGTRTGGVRHWSAWRFVPASRGG